MPDIDGSKNVIHSHTLEIPCKPALTVRGMVCGGFLLLSNNFQHPGITKYGFSMLEPEAVPAQFNHLALMQDSIQNSRRDGRIA